MQTCLLHILEVTKNSCVNYLKDLQNCFDGVFHSNNKYVCAMQAFHQTYLAELILLGQLSLKK
jgi:hypothetical protein